MKCGCVKLERKTKWFDEMMEDNLIWFLVEERPDKDIVPTME